MAHEFEQIRLAGAQLGYGVHGAGAGKPPLVFAHGYAMRSTGRLYGELLGLLARRFAVHVLDLRGHGASAIAVAGWSFEALANDLVAFSQALGLDGPIFVGHSFGAIIGLLAEIRHPSTFTGLCLLSPGPAAPRHDPVDTLDALIAHGPARDMLRDGFRQMFVRQPGEMLELALDAATLVDAGVHRAQKEQKPHFSIDDRLKDVSAPVLLVCGEIDNVVPPARQHDMARKLPRSKEVVFSGEGHMMAFERPAVAAREVITFFDYDKELMLDGPS